MVEGKPAGSKKSLLQYWHFFGVDLFLRNDGKINPVKQNNNIDNNLEDDFFVASFSVIPRQSPQINFSPLIDKIYWLLDSDDLYRKTSQII